MSEIIAPSELPSIPRPTRAELLALTGNYERAARGLRQSFNKLPPAPGVDSDIPTLICIANALVRAEAARRDLDHTIAEDVRPFLDLKSRNDFKSYLDKTFGGDPENERLCVNLLYARADLLDEIEDIEFAARKRCLKDMQYALTELEQVTSQSWMTKWFEARQVDAQAWKRDGYHALFDALFAAPFLNLLFRYRDLVNASLDVRAQIRERVKPKANEKTGELPPAEVFDPADVSSIPMRQWVLGDRFLSGAVTLGYAAPGLAKTLLASVSAIAIASGHSTTGETVHRTGNVLIVNNEETKDELKRRLGAAVKELGVELKHEIHMMSGLDDGAIILVRKDRSGAVTETACVQTLIDRIKANHIVHIVLDPLVSFHAGIDENNNAEMNKVLVTIARIAAETGCSIDCIHHSRKGDRKASSAETIDRDGGRGAFAQLGVARSSYQLVRIGEKSLLRRRVPQDLHRNRLISMVAPKRNYSADSDEAVAAFYLKSVAIPNGQDGGDGDQIGVPIKIDLLSPENVLSHNERVVQIIAGQMEIAGVMRASAKEHYAAIRAVFNVAQRTAERYIKEALGDGEPIEIELVNGNRYSVEMECHGKGKAGDIVMTPLSTGERDDDI